MGSLSDRVDNKGNKPSNRLNQLVKQAHAVEALATRRRAKTAMVAHRKSVIPCTRGRKSEGQLMREIDVNRQFLLDLGVPVEEIEAALQEAFPVIVTASIPTEIKAVLHPLEDGADTKGPRLWRALNLIKETLLKYDMLEKAKKHLWEQLGPQPEGRPTATRAKRDLKFFQRYMANNGIPLAEIQAALEEIPVDKETEEIVKRVEEQRNSSVVLNDLQKALIEALASGERYIAIRAGWGSGKTTALVFAMVYLSKTLPGTTILLVTDTARRFETVFLPECNKWLVPLGWAFFSGRSGAGVWHDLVSGTKVHCVSYHRASNRSTAHNPLEGINITSGVCLIDECQTLSEEVAVKAFGRLRSGGQPQLVMAGLPVHGAWWENYAIQRGGRVLLYSSYVNKRNLTEGWLDAVKDLPDSEREAMVENRPPPPEGQIYSEWLPAEYPEGNLAPPGWTYSPEMEGRLAADFGLLKPWVGVIVYDPDLEADILVAELTPKNVSVHLLVRLILMVCWPREFKDRMPDDGRTRFLIDAASGDKAGRKRSDQTLQSTVQVLANLPPEFKIPEGVPGEEYGIGIDVRTVTSPVKTDVANGIQKMKNRIAERKILCEKSVWERGIEGKQDEFMVSLGVVGNGNSFARSLMSYKYKANSTEPDKNGTEDPVDAVRYDIINWRWSDTDSVIAVKTAASHMNLSHIKTRAGQRFGSHTPWRQRRG